MKIIGVIPSRIGSTRLPEKPLVKINGKTMIEWVVDAAINSKLLDKTILATDSTRISELFVESDKLSITVSDNDYLNGTERVLDTVKGLDFDYIINIQGDEPTLTPDNLDELVTKLKSVNRADIDVFTPFIKSNVYNDFINPNIVKLVTNSENEILYFSRTSIPYQTSDSFKSFKKHIGIYIYTKRFTELYPKMKSSYLEKSEKLEQLQFLFNEFKMYGIGVDWDIISVDTIEDVERVRSRIEEIGK